jgi:adenosylcobinamide kinase/adenosylcobinamide-phosphate guanylyltransferase
MKLILVTGGARGGKSGYAEARAKALGGDDVTYIATARPIDDETRARIARHRATRPAAWRTVEAPSTAAGAIAEAATGVVLLDCMTLLSADALERPSPPNEEAAVEVMVARADQVLRSAAARSGVLIVVTNEVGFGVHPASEIGRWFQDGLGRVNQRLAAAADEVVLLIAGIPLTIKPAGST